MAEKEVKKQVRNARDKHGRFVAGGVPWNAGGRMPAEAREKQSLTRRRLFSEGRLRAWNKGRRLSKKHVASLKKARADFYRKNPSAAAAFGRRMKRLWENPERKKSANKKRIKTMGTAAFRERMSEIKKKHYKKNPELAGQISMRQRLRYAVNPELREEASRKAREVFKEHPNLRKEARERFFEKVINNPEFLKAMRHSKGNPNPLDVRTLKGNMVRSTYEKKVADVLFMHKIRYSYEIQALVFEKERKWTIPDFWLPDYNCIIEVYGGYPGSRGKTIWKNRIYRKYELPFIGITPSETLNLAKCLLDELKNIGRNPRLSKKALSILMPLPGA